jgi:hypothetical protein
MPDSARKWAQFLAMNLQAGRDARKTTDGMLAEMARRKANDETLEFRLAAAESITGVPQVFRLNPEDLIDIPDDYPL